MPDIPTSTADLWLKQIDHTNVNELGRAALDFAFPNFIPPKGALRPVRRFSGDDTLPRGRYYSLAYDETGFDRDTLMCELLAYRDPSRSGPIAVFDSTAPEQTELRAFVAQEGAGHTLMVFFPLVGGKPHPFAVTHGVDEAFQVMLPLTVRAERIERIIDLRERAVAEWFTRHFTALKHDQFRGEPFPVWPFRAPLTSFLELLPTLLAQEHGGDNFSMVAAAWLRRNGAQGLIYPSARRDCGVVYTNNVVTDWRGWNFVDYRGAPPPSDLHIIGNQVEWDDVVCIGPDEPMDVESERVACDGISIGARRDPADPYDGTWLVSGLSGKLRTFEK